MTVQTNQQDLVSALTSQLKDMAVERFELNRRSDELDKLIETKRSQLIAIQQVSIEEVDDPEPEDPEAD